MMNLNNWAKKIEEKELPILQDTSTSIMHKVNREETTANQLAKIILRDSSLTARLLRLSNSIIFNPYRMPVNTIHRAVLFLGFDMIRSMCLTLSMIDTLLQSNSQAHVKSLMAKSFHAAVVARDLAERRGDKASEEVFIAALLSSIGEIAFCCVAEEQAVEIRELEATGEFTRELAQRNVLGFTYDELSLQLTSDLAVGALLEETFSYGGKKEPRVKEIRLGRKISQHNTRNPENEETRKLVSELADYLGEDVNKTWSILREQAKMLKDTVMEYGAREIIDYLPVMGEVGGSENNAGGKIRIPDYPEEDAAVQLGILKDLGEALQGGTDLSSVLQIVLEGINRGVGMDRALVALLNPERNFIKGKFAVGIDIESLQDHFNFMVEPDNLFFRILESGRGVWVRENHADGLYSLLNRGASKVLGTSSFLLYPIIVNRRSIGLLYADRQPSKREINNDHFLNFNHFGQQACMAISHLADKRP